MRLLKNYFFILIIFLNCVSSNVLKKPEWTNELLLPNQYRGLSTNRVSEEEAIKEARNNAIKTVMEEVGISITAESERKRSEDAEGINLEFKDNLRGKTKGRIKGIKEISFYSMKSRNGKGYDAWVLISIPPNEIERARDELKVFEAGVIKESILNFAMAEELEKENDFVKMIMCISSLRITMYA